MFLAFIEVPSEEGPVTVSKIGADFCISFNNLPPTIQLLCNDVDELGASPPPVLTWYKDDVLAITMNEQGDSLLNEEFFNQSNNGLLRFGVLEPPPLVALGGIGGGGGQLFLNFIVSNITMPTLVPPEVDTDNIEHELFSVLLGNWECRLSNTFGEDSALTELSDCGEV